MKKINPRTERANNAAQARAKRLDIIPRSGQDLHPHLDVIDRVREGARVVVDVNPPNRLLAPDTEEGRFGLGARGARELEQPDSLVLPVVDADVPAGPKKEPGQLQADPGGPSIGEAGGPSIGEAGGPSIGEAGGPSIGEDDVQARLHEEIPTYLLARREEETGTDDVEGLGASRRVEVRRVGPRGYVVPNDKVLLEPIGETNAEHRVRALIQRSRQWLFPILGDVRLFERLDALQVLALGLVEGFEFGLVEERRARLGETRGCGDSEGHDAKYYRTHVVTSLISS